MAIFAQPGERYKQQSLMRLDQQEVERICREHGHAFRQTTLTPAETVRHFVWQVTMGNVPVDDVRHHANGAFTASAYCQARQRLSMKVLATLSEQIVEVALAGAESIEPLWLGHRVYRLDGSGICLPDAPQVRKHFGCSGRQKRGCGYPTAHVLLLTGPGGVAVKTICSPLRTGDMTHAAKTHGCLQAGDILLGDGLFGGWGHLQQLQEQQLHGVFPAHHSRKIDFGKNARHGANRRFVKSLGYHDQLVEYRKPSSKPKWMSVKQFKNAPQWILVREVRRHVKVGGVGREVTLVTTLLDAKKYPPKALVKLLGERWAIEVNLRSLKTTMGLERLRCKTVEGVLKELLTYQIVYNLVRLCMLEAAERQHIPVARISFADALSRLRWGVVQTWVDLEINPERPGRIEPRVVKRRPKAYATMQKPRATLRRLLIRNRKNKAA